jgi:hypothetical protein
MRLMGYSMRRATDAEAIAARERGVTMHDWPAQGAVVFENGVAVVKFSEP